MDLRTYWLTLLFAAIIGPWLWNHATAVAGGPLTSLLNFAAGVAMAGAAVLLARYAAGLDRSGRGGKQ